MESPKPRAVRILSVGTANPPKRYTQGDILNLLPFVHPIVKRLIKSSHIESRHLFLPPLTNSGKLRIETQSELIKKHRKGSFEIGTKAVNSAILRARLKQGDIGFLCCVTSTGFMCPGLSAMFLRHLELPFDCQRLDLVGMGCHGGLNGLNAVTSWAAVNPEKNALLLCCEINSAIYAHDDSIQTWIVNSLFGDGAAAIIVRARTKNEMEKAPCVLGFQSHIIPDQWEAMHFNWNEEQGRWAFHLSRDIPYIIGNNLEIPVSLILTRFGLKKKDIRHWIVHAGGPALVKAIRSGLQINNNDLRHTISVLRDFGNLSSGSFLFSFQRLLEEGSIQRGDYGIMLSMGPGATIETALIRW